MSAASSSLHRTVACIESDGVLDDVDVRLVVARFRSHGLVLIRGCAVDQQGFRNFSQRITPEFVVHPNTERQRYEDRTLTGVSPGMSHFFPHAELGYAPLRPHIAWFYCMQPSSHGGETTVCDGVEVLRELRPATREHFERKRILFRDALSREAWSEIAGGEGAWQSLFKRFNKDEFSFFLDAAGNLRSRFVVSAIVRTRSTGELAFCNSLLDSTEPCFEDESAIPRDALHDVIATSEELSVPIPWRAGDVLLVDNSRFMHGRRAFKDPARKILVRFANVGASSALSTTHI